MKVVEYILDRNACLLPAYFAVTEIRKLYPEGALSHWVTHSSRLLGPDAFHHWSVFSKSLVAFLMH